MCRCRHNADCADIVIVPTSSVNCLPGKRICVCRSAHSWPVAERPEGVGGRSQLDAAPRTCTARPTALESNSPTYVAIRDPARTVAPRSSSRSGHPLHLWCGRSGCQPGPPDCADARSRMPLCHRRSGGRSAQSQGRHNRRSAWPCLPSPALRSKVLAEPDPRGERDQQVEALLILDLVHDDALQVSSATSLAPRYSPSVSATRPRRAGPTCNPTTSPLSA